MEQEQIDPMTPEEVEAEEVFVEKIFEEYKTPEKINQMLETIRRRKQSKAATVSTKESIHPS
jgi:hypothetical protein